MYQGSPPSTTPPAAASVKRGGAGVLPAAAGWKPAADSLERLRAGEALDVAAALCAAPYLRLPRRRSRPVCACLLRFASRPVVALAPRRRHSHGVFFGTNSPSSPQWTADIVRQIPAVSAGGNPA